MLWSCKLSLPISTKCGSFGVSLALAQDDWLEKLWMACVPTTIVPFDEDFFLDAAIKRLKVMKGC